MTVNIQVQGVKCIVPRAHTAMFRNIADNIEIARDMLLTASARGAQWLEIEDLDETYRKLVIQRYEFERETITQYRIRN